MCHFINSENLVMSCGCVIFVISNHDKKKPVSKKMYNLIMNYMYVLTDVYVNVRATFSFS